MQQLKFSGQLYLSCPEIRSLSVVFLMPRLSMRTFFYKTADWETFLFSTQVFVKQVSGPRDNITLVKLQMKIIPLESSIFGWDLQFTRMNRTFYNFR